MKYNKGVGNCYYFHAYLFNVCNYYHLNLLTKKKKEKFRALSQTSNQSLQVPQLQTWVARHTTIAVLYIREQDGITFHPLKPLERASSSCHFPSVGSSMLNLLRSSKKEVWLAIPSSSLHRWRHQLPCRLFARTNCHVCQLLSCIRDSKCFPSASCCCHQIELSY